MSNNNTRILSQPISYQELKLIRRLKIAGIYRIQNNINHKVYIGKSMNIIGRLKNHITSEENEHLRNSFKKYGFDNFTFEVIKQTYDLDYWEIFLIQIHHSTDDRYGYNNTPGGDGGDYWCCLSEERSEEIKQKIRDKRALQAPRTKEQEEKRLQNLAKFWSSPEGLDKKKELSEKSKQHKQPKELRWYNNGIESIKARECPVGYVPGRLGNFTQSEEANQKRSDWYNNLTEEERYIHNKKAADARKGKPKSDTCKSNISKANKGRKYYNNGIIEVMQFEQPEGFVPGRLPSIKKKISEGNKKRTKSNMNNKE